MENLNDQEAGEIEVYAARSDDEWRRELASKNQTQVSSEGFIQRDPSEGLELDLPPPQAGRDFRLYVPKHAGWVAVIKESWEQEHCYAKNPGEDWFHLLANGEIFIQRGAEKYCLTCALRQKILTQNRLFWQKGSSQAEEAP